MTIERHWHLRTIRGTEYQFEAEVDEGLWRVNTHQKNHDGTWTRLLGSWSDTPREETPAEALVAFAQRFAFFAESA